MLLRGGRRAAAALQRTGLGVLLRRVGVWRGVVAFAYHRIGDPSGSPFDHGLYSATADEFDRHVRLMKKHSDVIGPGDLKDAMSRGRGRYTMITFDDGYRDNYDAAFPVLKSNGVPGVFFVSTGFIDQPRLPWWDEIAWMARTTTRDSVPAGPWLAQPVSLGGADREPAIRALLRKYKSLPAAETRPYLDYLANATGCGEFAGDVNGTWMDWSMIRRMRDAGMFVGGHTVNHPVLARLPREGQRLEVNGCARRLQEELGQPMRWFSYPVGGPDAFNADTRDCMEEAGVEAAFTYYGTFCRPDKWDRHAVPRAAVERYTTLEDLYAVMTLPHVFS